MDELVDLQKELKIKRERRRKDSLKIDKEKVAQRIRDFYDEDTQARSDDIELRLQRYAKYRGWTEGKDWPWESCSDAFIPDMMTSSLRVQDTLYNAVISTRPVITSRALKRQDAEKQERVDSLIDYQVFVEQKGDITIGEMAESFVNDGVFTVFIPWVREDRNVSDIRIFDPIPDDVLPIDYFRELIRAELGPSFKKKKTEWDWLVFTDGPDVNVSFYTREDRRVEMIIERDVRIFDGPKLIVKDYEDVICPPRSANLQIPGPSNPGGAHHVILRDYPQIDEIARLQKSGFYDLIDAADIEEMQNVSKEDDKSKKQKDDLAGTVENESKDKRSNSLTRLMVFDIYDIDGDGIGEDVIFWYILETKKLLKAKILTEMYPANPPRRPLAEAQFLPVKGRRSGIGLLELMEGIHDMIKATYDQTIDHGTISNSPFGFYRASGSLKPEVIRMSPGELYPLGDPQRDINFPTLGNNSQAFGINLISLLNQMEEKLTMVGDLQFGRVPQGKASALRTAGGMQSVLTQGEARPERILRRFFIGLSEIWHQIHELDQFFLPKSKQYRILGYDSELDPYQEVTDKKQIEGRFQFDFSANILNSSRGALGQALNSVMAAFISDLTMQLGIIDKDGVYRLLSDFGKATGIDPKRYLKKPAAQSDQPKILAEEAISSIMDGQMPFGEPLEGFEDHLNKLMEFQGSDNFGHLDQAGVAIFQAYIADVARRAQQIAMQQQAIAAAGGFGGMPQQPQGMAPMDNSPTPVSENELLDETLPSNGRG